MTHGDRAIQPNSPRQVFWDRESSEKSALRRRIYICRWVHNSKLASEILSYTEVKTMHAAPDADRNDVAARLAELEEQLELGVEAADSDSTAADLKAELDTILEELKRPAVADFENESACGRVTEMVKSIGQDAADLSAEFDAARAEAKSPTSALGNLGQYTLLAKLGEGGMGTVYKARHTRLDKVVALKVLPPERMRDAQAVARFEREMRAVGKLDHPHIVRAMDAGEVNGTRFLVM